MQVSIFTKLPKDTKLALGARMGPEIALPQSAHPQGRLSPTQALQRLDRWIGLSQTTQREWSQRLPAVGVAGTLLAFYAWGVGLKPIDLRVALWLGLAAAILGSFTDSK